MLNIIIGLGLVAAALFGGMTLMFTDSSTALALFGGAIALYGAYQTFGGRSSE